MQNSPLFQHSDASLTLDEERNVAVKRMYAIHNEQFITLDKVRSYSVLNP